MPFDADSFLADILDKVDGDKKKAVEEALKDPVVVKALDSGYRRQDDYSRSMDELTKARSTAEAEVQQAMGALKSQREQLVDWYADANDKYRAALDQARRYQAEYGNLEDGEEVKHKIPENLLTKEEHEERLSRALDEHSRHAIKFADVLTDLKMTHKDRFGEMLNTEELYTFQAKSGLPLPQAYKEFISPRVEAAEKEKYEKAVEQAREEGLREGRSQAQMPVRPDAANPVMQALGNPTTSEDRVNAAVSAWRQGNHEASP